MTLRFDWEAEQIVIDHCKKLGFPVRLLSEERGEVLIGSGTPKYVLIVDPLDGSTNYKQKIEISAFSIAAIPAGKSLALENVEYALIGSLWSGNVFSAQKGGGAFYNGKRASASGVTDLSKAIITIDLDFSDKKKWKRVGPVIEKSHMIRRMGANALDTAFVSIGAYDAMIDVRDRLTPENFMAGYLLVKEAGGIFTDPFGNELPEITDLTTPYNVVAAGNTELHREILGLLDMQGISSGLWSI